MLWQLTSKYLSRIFFAHKMESVNFNPYSINEHNVLAVLISALDNNQELFINKCFAFINQVEEKNVFYWNKKKGIELQFNRFTQNMQTILKFLIPRIYSITLTEKCIGEETYKKLPFQSARKVTLLGDLEIPTMVALSQIFPQAEKLVLSKKTYESLNNASTNGFKHSWKNIKKVQLMGGIEDPGHLFPNLQKLCLFKG